MMLQALLTLSIATVALAQLQNGCCVPLQWEGIQAIAGGYSKIIRKGQFAEDYYISYDANSTQVAAWGRVFIISKGKQIPFKVIYDYGTKKGYHMQTEKKKCKTFDLKGKFRPFCMRENAKKLAESFFGLGDEKVDVTAYKTNIKGKRVEVNDVAVVMSNGCVPVSEDIGGKRGWMNFFMNINTYGITAGIKDPKVFSPPDYCKENSNDDLGEHLDQLGDGFFEEYSTMQFTHPGLSAFFQEQLLTDEPLKYYP